MIYSRNWLINEIKSGNKSEFILFWGHRRPKDGRVGKSCFSQWYDSPFTVENVKYSTAEHWMMAEKARIFNDLGILKEIIAAPSPEKAKALGRKIKNFDEKTWDEKKYQIVVDGNYHKFSQDDLLRNFLLATANKIIVEASPLDPVWGIGLDQENPDALIPENWPGTNLLGFALMEVRDLLRIR